MAILAGISFVVSMVTALLSFGGLLRHESDTSLASVVAVLSFLCFLLFMSIALIPKDRPEPAKT